MTHLLENKFIFFFKKKKIKKKKCILTDICTMLIKPLSLVVTVKHGKN